VGPVASPQAQIAANAVAAAARVPAAFIVLRGFFRAKEALSIDASPDRPDSLGLTSTLTRILDLDGDVDGDSIVDLAP
jgi:hypothetical protein